MPKQTPRPDPRWDQRPSGLVLPRTVGKTRRFIQKFGQAQCCCGEDKTYCDYCGTTYPSSMTIIVAGLGDGFCSGLNGNYTVHWHDCSVWHENGWDDCTYPAQGEYSMAASIDGNGYFRIDLMQKYRAGFPCLITRIAWGALPLFVGDPPWNCDFSGTYDRIYPVDTGDWWYGCSVDSTATVL